METALPTTRPVRFGKGGPETFYPTLRRRVDTFFQEKGRTSYANGMMWAKVVMYFGLWVGSYVALLLTTDALLATALAWIFGILSVLIAFNIGHDATHGALSPNPGINRSLAILSLSLPGGNAYLYNLVHNPPHPFPNVTGVDVTLDQVGAVLRLSPATPLHRYHRWQHLYAPFVYSLYSIFLVFVKDFKIFSRRRIGNHTVGRHPTDEKILLLGFKALYLIYALLVPLWILPFPWQGILSVFLITHLSMGILITIVLQPVHLAIDLHFAQPDGQGRISSNWAVYQMEATKDYAPESRLANFLIGGLNTHAIHHLFPAICHIHYRPLTRILRQTCAEFGVSYSSCGFGSAVASHYAFLRLMGKLSSVEVTPRGTATRLDSH